MSKPDETSVGGKLGFPGLGEFFVSQKFTHKNLRITAPEQSEISDPQPFIDGLGAKEDLRIILVNEILGVGCYLQSDIGEPNSNGEWHVQTKFSDDLSGKERVIFALAIKENDVKRVFEVIAKAGKIKKIAQFERILKSNKIKYQISIGKKLIFRKKTSIRVSETAQAKNIVLYNEKDESMSVGPKIIDGVGGLFSGTYKVLHFSKSDIGKFLNITVESYGHHLWIEIFRGAYNGADINGWQARRKEVYRSGGSKVNPSLKWKISDAGEYTVYFVRHSKEGEKAKYNISYKIEIASNP